MHELYELKEMLCKELEEYGKKGELTSGSLDVVDKLAHTIKNMGRGGNRVGSYARGRNAKRDSRGRYSSEGYSRASEDVVEQLNEMMEDAPENMKHEIKRFITKLENM